MRSSPDSEAIVATLDIGTSSCKAGLFDLWGRPLGSVSAPYPTYYPAPGHAEQAAEDWWDASCTAMRRLLSGVPSEVSRRIKVAAISGHTPTIAIVDVDGRPLTRALTWLDTRGTEQVEQLRASMQGLSAAGVPLANSWPPARILWMQQHFQHLLRSGVRFVQPKDYVYFRLTGEWVTDAGTWRGLVDLNSGRLDPQMASVLGGFDETWLPPVLPPTSAPGQVTLDAAKCTGLPAGIPVAVGWPDSWSHVAGTGLGRLARGFDVSGSSEVVGMASQDGPVQCSRLLVAPVTQDTVLVYGGTQAGGRSLEWWAGIVNGGTGARAIVSPPRREGLVSLVEMASKAPPGSNGLLFLPYLAGERAPIWNARARGVFFGLSVDHDTACMTRAVLEGVAFSIRDVLETAAECLGARPEAVAISGGPSRLPLWNQIKADVLGIPTVTMQVEESGLLGSAILASVCAGFYPGLEQAIKAMVHTRSTYVPRDAYRQVYDDLFARYRSLYDCVRSLF